MRILLFINNKFTIFANRLTTNVDMQRTGTINNSLNMRGLQELPPPICRNNVNNKFTGTANPHSSLLHQAHASCGRVFLCLSLRSVRNGETHINY